MAVAVALVLVGCKATLARYGSAPYIDASDSPAAWLGWPLTVEVEAKAKALAVGRLQSWLEGSYRVLTP